MANQETDTAKIVLATPAPISHRTAEENLGLGYLAAVLRKNSYSVEIVDGWLENLTPEQIADRILVTNNPLYVGFAAYRSNMGRAIETVRKLRQAGFNKPIIAGGFGPTFHASEFLRAGFDIAIRGEGEQSVLDLASYYTEGTPPLEQISGASFYRDGQEYFSPIHPLNTDIDFFPFPSRDTMPLVITRKTPVHIVSARGCEANCLFCSIVSFQRLARGPQWRQRSIENFVDEMDQLYQQGATHFKVIDDSFIEPPRDELWCRNLADEIALRGLNVTLRGSIRADRVTESVIRELKRAGFISFSCGVENFSQSALTRMNKTATADQNQQALELFRKYELITQQGMILFDHGTTMEELEENYTGMRQYDHTVIKGVFTEMFAAEGTPYTRLLNNRGILEVDQSGLGNHRYQAQDKRVSAVYHALKTWHKSHASIYDQVIDPVSAPKALEPYEFAIFMPLVRGIRHKDLDFMRDALDLSSQISPKELLAFTQQRIEAEKLWFENFKGQVDAAYSVCGLIYKADENPFLC